MRKKEHGFTLIELLAVIVILALILIIAIPAVLTSMRAAQKESLYLYAQSLHSKAIAQYTQDLEHNKKNTSCAVYDIEKDLDLPNTGNYEGWVRVKREAVSSGKSKVAISLPYDQAAGESGIKYPKYCINEIASGQCKPINGVAIDDEATKLVISEAVEEGEQLCVNYMAVNNNKLVTKATKCMQYDAATAVTDTYKYNVTLSIKDNTYAVENVTIGEKGKDETNQDAFYKNIRTKDLVIDAPSCSTNDGSKGETTTTQVNITTSTSTTRQQATNKTTTKKTTSKVVVGPGTTTKKTTTQINQGTTTKRTSTQIGQGTTTKRTSTQISQGTTTSRTTQTITVITTTSKSTQTQTVTVTTTKGTTVPTTTTTTVKKPELLLSSLSVAGHANEINFHPLKFYYEVRLPYSEDHLNVSATTEVETSQIGMTGFENIPVGKTVGLVIVHDPYTGKKAYYQIAITRLGKGGEVITTTKPTKPIDPNHPEEGKPDPTLPSSNASLRYLSISNYELDFSPEVYDYTLTTIGEKKLHVNYRAESEAANVSVYGNEDLKDGDEIVIHVQSENGKFHQTYTIKIKVAKETTNTTKVLRGSVIGLVILLAIILLVIYLNRRKGYTGNSFDKDNKNNPQSANNLPGQ